MDMAALSDTISFHFNTSNVNIQYDGGIKNFALYFNFNTSNVNIQ